MLVEADDTVEADKVLSGRERGLAHSGISELESKGWLMTAYLAIQRQLGRRSHWRQVEEWQISLRPAEQMLTSYGVF